MKPLPDKPLPDMPPAALWAAVLSAALLAGCAVGPDFRPPEQAAPADWSGWHGGSGELLDPELRGAAARADGDEPWWRAWRDPALDALMQRAQEANQDLQQAALRYAQSRMARIAAAAQRGPQADAQAGASRQRQSEYGAGVRMTEAMDPASRERLVEVLSDPYALYQAGFDASWELDLWGRVRRVVESADAQVQASAAALADVRRNVLGEAARGYFELRGVQRQLRLLRADVAAGEETLALVQARAAGGLTDQLDVIRQRTQLADLRARLPGLLEQETRLRNAVAALAGERPGALQDLLDAPPPAAAAGQAGGRSAAAPATAGAAGANDAPGATDTGDAIDPAGPLPDLSLGVPSELAGRRPDIRAALARLHAATAEVGVAEADLYPRIVLGAGFGFESYRGERFGDWGSRQWSVGPSLSLPVFDRGRRRATVVLRELQQQEAAVAYQQTVLRAWHEVDDALTGYSAERRRHGELAAKARDSRDAYELARARYEAGMTDFLVQLDAWRALLQARREYADSGARLAVQWVAVRKALGWADPAAPGPAL